MKTFTKLELDNEVVEYLKGSVKRAESRNWVVHLHHAQMSYLSTLFYIVSTASICFMLVAFFLGAYKTEVACVMLSIVLSVYAIKETTRLAYKRVKHEQCSIVNLELRRDAEFYKNKIYPLLKKHSFYVVYKNVVDCMYDDDVAFVKDACNLDKKLNQE